MAEVALPELADFPADELQRCRAAGAVGRAILPLPKGEGTPRHALRRLERLRTGESAAGDSPFPLGNDVGPLLVPPRVIEKA